MSTYKSIDAVINEIEYWMRLSTLLHSGLKEWLLAILHNDKKDPSYTGLPRDPTKLYNELNTTHQATLLNLRKKIISKEQWDILFPNSGTTDSGNFDTTLTVILLTNICGLQPPATGWNHRTLPANDNSKEANIIRAREWRNFVHHTNPTSIDVIIFKNKWAEGMAIINTLGFNFDAKKLLNSSLDPKTSQQQNLILKVLDDFCKNEVVNHGKDIKGLNNRLNTVYVAVKSVQSDIGDLKVRVQENSSLITEQDKELKSLQTNIGDITVKTKQNSSLITEQDKELKSLQTNVGDITVKAKQNSSLITEQDKELKSLQTNVGDINVKTKENTSLITEQDKELKSLQTNVGDITVKAKENSSLITEQDKELKSLQTDVGDITVKTKENTSLITEQDKELKSLQTNVGDITVKAKQNSSLITEQDKELKSLQTNVGDITVKAKENSSLITEQDKELKSLQTDVGDITVKTKENTSLITEQDKELKSLQTNVGDITVKAKQNSSLITEQDKELKSLQTNVGDITVKAKENSSLIIEQDKELKSLQTNVGDITVKTKENSSLITEQEKELKSLQTDVGDISVKTQANIFLITEQDKELKSLQTDVGDISVKVQANSSEITEQFKELKSFKSDIGAFDSRLTHLECRANESTEEKCLDEKMDVNNSKRMMEVISYLPNGCIFKIQVQSGYQIQSLKIRCICDNRRCVWVDVKQNNDEVNGGDGENCYYTVKDLDDETMMLKIENLTDRRKYGVQLLTNQRLYVDEVITPESDFCTHVTNVDDVFILLTPLLGQNNEPLNCDQGLHGYFVKDDDKITTFISDGTKKNKMTVKQFDAFSDAYLARNFRRLEKVLVFPLIQMIFDLNVRHVAEIFNKFLSTRTKFRAILTNLNSKKYIQCCRAIDQISHANLSYYNRLQVFDQTTASILNIRVNNTHLKRDVHNEIESTVLDLQCFISSHRHHSCSCCVIGALAFPNLSRSDIESYVSYYYPKKLRKYTKLFYLSKEDLQNVDNLRDWWNNIYREELKKYSGDISDFNIVSFKTIVAQSIATIALTETSLNLPTLSEKDKYNQIISLLLNPDQIKAIESPSNRKIIIGNYGSGKSIILDEIAKRKFCENLHSKVKVLIIYAIWEEFSLVEITKKMFLDNLKKDHSDCSSYLTIISGNMHQIWNDLKKKGEVKFLLFLHHFLEESGYHTVHILIDELPTDVVNVAEVTAINNLFKRHPNSSVTIAPQSIIIDRSTSTKDGEINHNRNCLDQMEMDRFELVEVMRNTIQINAVVNASQKKLQGSETLLSVYNPSVAADTMVTKLKKKINEGVSQSNETKKSIEEANQEKHSSSAKENVSSVSQSQVSIMVPAPKFEQIAKFVHNEKASKESTTTFKTTYSFHAIQNGNGIKDQKPTLIKLPSEVNFESEMSAKILKELLQELCLQTLAQTIILCKSIQEIKQVSYCLSHIPDFRFVTYIPQLQGVFPNFEERLAIFSEFREGSCVLTDSTGIKGMEAKRVIIFASQHEHFQRHDFIDAISRGNVWSYIFFHSLGQSDNRETLGDIIKELEIKRLFHVRTVQMFEDDTNFDIPSNDTNSDIFKINKVHLKNQELKQTFGKYQMTFNIEYPVKRNIEDYRKVLHNKIADVENEKVVEVENEKVVEVENEKISDDKFNDIKTGSIFHEIIYEGKKISFYDVYRLLKNEDYKTFRELLKYNGNMLNNMRDGTNYTFLIHASFVGSHSIVKYLTKQFADEIDVWVGDEDGRNAYYWAAWFDYVDVMKVLISFDRSRLNDADDDGRTPLHRAAIENSKRMVKLLLDAGADVDVEDIHRNTPDRDDDVDDDIRKIIENHRKKSSS